MLLHKYMEGGEGQILYVRRKKENFSTFALAKSQNGRRAGGRSLHEGKGKEVKARRQSTKGQRAGGKGKEGKGRRQREIAKNPT